MRRCYDSHAYDQRPKSHGARIVNHPRNGESRRGEIIARAQVMDRVQPGLIFATFHCTEGSANWLTNSVLDSVSKTPDYKECAARIEAVTAQQNKM